MLLRQNRNPLIVPSPLHDVSEGLRTLDAVATANEANELVFAPLAFLLSPFTCAAGVQEIAPLEVIANPDTSEHLRPPVYSSHSPMGRMTVLTAWSVIGTVVAYQLPLPDGTETVSWTDFTLPATILVCGLAVLGWVLGLAATLLAGRFNLVPVMNSGTYRLWAICAALGGLTASILSRTAPP